MQLASHALSARHPFQKVGIIKLMVKEAIVRKIK